MPHPAHVLVVDDMQVNQMILNKVLNKFGCQTDVADNGLQAVEKSAASSYDIIFMDCNMPEMDGFEATRVIRARDPGHNEKPVIIAITADGLSGDRERCLNSGMNDYLTKPFKAEDVNDLLNKWMESR